MFGRLKSVALDYEYSGCLENRWSFMISRWFGLARKLKFKDGYGFTMNKNNAHLASLFVKFAFYGGLLSDCDSDVPFSWKVCLDDNVIVSPHGLRFNLNSFDPLIFAETYVWDIHFCGFDLTGKVVIDVGGYVGDTALYFASKGAKVYVYEPDPLNYSKLLKNLELNPELLRMVKPYNMAVGVDGEVSFRFGQWGNSSTMNPHGRPKKVKSVSLKTILEENSLSGAYLLKADCKGCEFELARQSEIGLFDQLSIEYTNTGRHSELLWLVKSLRGAGFNLVRVYKHSRSYAPLYEHGMIRAEKSR